MVLPHDELAEQKVLGYLLSIEDTTEKLKPEFFYMTWHQKIYKAMLEGYFDITEVIANQFEFDFFKYMDCVEAYSIGNVEKLIGKVAENYYRRKGINELTLKERDLYDVSKELPAEILELTSIKDDIQHGDSLKDAVLESWEDFSEINHRFTNIKRKMPAFEPSEVLLLAGRSGTGKTALGMQFANAIAEGMNEKWMFFSMEMSAKLVLKRCAMINYWERYKDSGTIELSNNWFSDNRLKSNAKGERFIDIITPERMILCDKAGLTIDAMRRRLKVAIKRDSDIKTILIDYVQLIKGKGTRREEMSGIARQFRSLGKEFDVRIIGLCQTSRDGEDGYIPVQLNHLKESGDWEEISDIVIGLWKNKKFEDCLNVKKLKDRNSGFEGMMSLKKYGLYFESPEPHVVENWKNINGDEE